MKTQPMDVVVGGVYDVTCFGAALVTAVKPKGRGWYVEYTTPARYIEFGGPAAAERMALETFRRLARINQQEAA